MTKTSLALCLALVGAAFSGCASAPPPPPPAAVAPAPAPNALRDELMDPTAPPWIRKGCAAYTGDKKKSICGVGAIGGMTNPGLARSAAESRGRAEIARSLKTRLKNMIKDYQGMVKGGPGNKLNNEEFVTDTTKQITNETLSGTRLEDTWVSKQGTFYALMVLDADAFRDQLKSMNQLDEQLRQAITERAEASFAELDEATEKTLPPLEGQQ